MSEFKNEELFNSIIEALNVTLPDLKLAKQFNGGDSESGIELLVSSQPGFFVVFDEKASGPALCISTNADAPLIAVVVAELSRFVKFVQVTPYAEKYVGDQLTFVTNSDELISLKEDAIIRHCEEILEKRARLFEIVD